MEDYVYFDYAPNKSRRVYLYLYGREDQPRFEHTRVRNDDGELPIFVRLHERFEGDTRFDEWLAGTLPGIEVSYFYGGSS